MNEHNEKPILLTVRETSMLLRVQRPKIYELIKDKVIEGFKVGADWRVRRDSVEKLIGSIPEGFFKHEETQDVEKVLEDKEKDVNVNGIRLIQGMRG